MSDIEITPLTVNQAAVVGAYTGFLVGNFRDMHEYVERVMDRPVWTHEMGTEEIALQIREASKEDFLRLVPENYDGPHSLSLNEVNLTD